MKSNFKRILSVLLVMLMVVGMLPTTFASASTPAPKGEELTDADYAIVNDVFAQIDAMEDAPAKKSASRTQLTDAAEKIVMSSENYVEGSLERNGNSFTWWTDEGIRCIYNPYMREKHENMKAPANPEPAGLYNEPKATKGGWPSGNQVYLIAPYYGLDDSFTNQYKNEAKAIASAIGDTDGYTLYSGTAVTIDKVADAMENGAVVIFDSHGTTDYDGSYVGLDPDGYEVYDYVSKAKYSYLCLTSKTGLTTADYTAGATYFTDSEGMMCACINGAAIANHMEKNSPAGLLWMAICLGMATDTFATPMRAKGVEVVYGYSQSVTFAGDYCYEETFWDNMIAGKTVAQSVAAMKTKWGNWDWSEAIASYYGYSGSGYSLSQARQYRAAFPVVVSDEDAHPGQRGTGTNYGACSEQNVKSTYTLYSQYAVTAQSNNSAYGTVSLSGNVITATPATGYFAQGYNILSGSATVSQNGNSFSVMAESDCTVEILFAPKTAVTVSFSGANVAEQNGYAGDSMTLPTATAPEGYKFLGWTTAPLSGDTTEKPDFYTDSFVPTGNTTLYALYSYVDTTTGGGSGDYVKVTETPDDWSGEYLIVYEAGSRVFDGSATTLEKVSNYQDVTITDNTISAQEADAYKFIIASMNGGYSIQSASGLYISGTSGSNKLNAGTSPAANTINITASGEADIVSNTSHLRYNATSGQDRFRYYKSTSYSSQKAIALYVKDGTAGTTYYTSSLCDHESTKEIAGVAATCTETGYTAGVQCVDCGSFLSGHEVIPALGHSFGDWTVTTQPGCETTGVQAHTCATCGISETQSVAALGHSVGEGSVTTAATCTTPGVMTYSCTACGEATTESIPATGHNYVANGLTYTCTNCGDSYTVSASETLKYVFSNYSAGIQYAEGEEHILDETVTLIINGAHLNTQIRLYAGSNAVFASAKNIDSITVKAGYKVGTLNVYSSADGSVWELVASQATTSSYVNYSFEMPSGTKYVMLEAVGAQVRVSEMSMEVSAAGGSVEPPVTEPSKPEITEPEPTNPEVTEPSAPAVGSSATIDFGSTAHRVTWDASSQIWSNGGATLTNNKAGSSSAVADYSNPARFYKNSEIVIEFAGMTKIEMTCTGTYATVLLNSLADADATVTQDGNVVTVSFASPVDSFTFVLTSGQVRMSKLTVYGGEEQHQHSFEAVVTAPTCTAEGYTTYICAGCGEVDEVTDYVNALGHSYESVVTKPTTTTQGYTTHTCTVCGDSYVDSYVDPIVLPSGTATLKLSGATLKLEADLTMKIMVNPAVFASGNYTNGRLEVSMTDAKTGIVNTVVFTDNYEVSGGYMQYVLTGISPRMMNDTLTIKLYGTFAGEEYEFSMTYSVATYAYNQLSRSKDAKFLTLLADLLNFGAAHQIYTGYNTENLVNAAMTETQKGYASTAAQSFTNKLNAKYEVIDNPTASFRGANVELSEKVEVQFFVVVSDLTGVTLEVTCDGVTQSIEIDPSTYNGTYYVVNFDGIQAKQLRSDITAKVCRDGVAISNTALYSVESYVARNISSPNTKLVDLLKMMMYYGDSAAAYFA